MTEQYSSIPISALTIKQKFRDTKCYCCTRVKPVVYEVLGILCMCDECISLLYKEMKKDKKVTSEEEIK